MSYKYMAWKEGSHGYWSGGKLLSSSQITALLYHLPKEVEKFESVQTYKEDGTATHCPIFADFDHKVLSRARTDTIDFTRSIMYHLNVIPDIYYSGNKGFHVIVPYELEHPKCHLLAKGVIDQLGGGLKTLDQTVYRTKSLLRMPNTPASKPGRFKIKIPQATLLHMSDDDLIGLSERPGRIFTDEYDGSKLNMDFLADMLKDIVGNLKSYDHLTTQMRFSMTPCIEKIFYTPVDEGSRNRSIFILAKFFKGAGKNLEDTLELLLEQEHYAQWERSGEVKVRSVVTSVFRNRISPTLGCKTGVEGEILREYCNDFCIFSDKFPDLNIRGNNATKTRSANTQAKPFLQSRTA